MDESPDISARIQVLRGDITSLTVDAIVNAANKTLLGGAGVDGAIHTAAGPQLVEECVNLGGCELGEAKITSGYDLPAKYVIHTVGPTWSGGTQNEAECLRNCYINSMKLAEEKGVKTLAFPNISTGVYGYPREEAADIAINAVKKFLQNSKIEKVIFICFNEENYNLYIKLLKS